MGRSSIFMFIIFFGLRALQGVVYVLNGYVKDLRLPCPYG